MLKNHSSSHFNSTFEYLILGKQYWPFKSESDVILADRFDSDILGDVMDKAYARDLFRRD